MYSNQLSYHYDPVVRGEEASHEHLQGSVQHIFACSKPHTHSTAPLLLITKEHKTKADTQRNADESQVKPFPYIFCHSLSACSLVET
jgi:hypothetical protein